MSSTGLENGLGLTLATPGEEEGGAIAAAVLFGLLWLACMANFRLTHFRVYLLSGLSAALRTVGYAVRAAFWAQGWGGNLDLEAVALVMSAAGYGISVAVQTLTMGCWFKNADADSKPQQPPSWPVLSVGVRLLIVPIIAFGPVLGVAIAALSFGVATPDALSTAATMRKASAWGLFGTEIVLLTLEGLAAAAAAAGSHHSRKTGGRDPNKLVFVTLLCSLLLFLAVIFRVVALYQPQFATNPHLYYTLTVLPELLSLTVICTPRLLAHMGMAARYEEWQAAARGGGKLPASSGFDGSKADYARGSPGRVALPEQV